MATLSKAQFEAAAERGREVLAREPRAVAVRYDQAAGRIVVDLVNGCGYAFPPQLVEDLQGASEGDLAKVEIDSVGLNLHWPALDVDLDVPALVSGLFGTRTWMTSELARIAGRKTSPAKTAAARENGQKGGRPRKAI